MGVFVNMIQNLNSKEKLTHAFLEFSFVSLTLKVQVVHENVINFF